MDHMKEPWSFAPDIEDEPSMDWNVFDAHGTLVCVTSEEDARRIVACVNACAGVSTETLEQKGTIPVAALELQRDELLSSLIEARHALQLANDSPGGPINDTLWMMHGPETLFDFMDAAIEKAKGLN